MAVRAETALTLARVNDGDNGVKVYDGTAGSVVTVSNASAYPALELVADIIPIQPNDYDSVWVGGGGKNVCVPFEGTKYGIVRTLNDDGTVAITGTATATSWSYLEEYYDLPYCGIDVGDTISIYSDVYLVVMAYNGNTSLGSKQSKDGTAATYTIPANTTRLRIIQYPKSTTPASGETFDTTARYWVSKSAFSSWEPYENICPIYGHDHCDVVVSPTLLDTDGTTYNTNFPQVVYGGTLDVVEGTLTVTYALMTFDGTQTFTDRISAQNRVYLQLGGMASQSGLNDDMVLCNALPKATGVQNADHPCIAVGVNNAYVYIQGVTHISGVTNLATLNTWLSNNPITFTYKLATPIVYSVSPKEIELLNGTNNVWANTGDITDFRYAEIAPATLETFGDARKVAVKYVTDMGDDGIIVHPENDNNDYAKINAEGMDVVVDGRSVAKYGVDARIGEEDGGRMLLDSESFKIVAENGAEAFLLSTGSSQVQTKVYASLQLHADPNKTDTGECYDLGSVSNGTSFDVRIKTYASYYNDGEYKTHTFTKGTSSTYSFTITPPIVSPPTYTVQVAYDGNKGFTITNGASRYYVEINELSYMKTVDKVVITLRNSPLADFVVDEGFDDTSGWKWRKWESGKVEAWYHDETYPDGWQTKINTSANGGFYISENIDVADYPSGLFAGQPERHATASSGDNYFCIALIGNSDNYDLTQNFGDVYWATTSARSSYHTYYIDLYAVYHPQ